MSSLSNILLDKEILLESGTNELELLVFSVADYTFGINVAKVREVLPWKEITNLPKAHPSICGVFKLREHVIPCVSLSRHLGIEAAREESDSTIILTDFNQQQTAFVVDSVDRIYRLSWENILAVPGLEALSQTPVTALARHESRLIVMLDFEMMLDSVTNQFFRTDAIDNPLGLPRETCRILLAEDSPTVREAIGTTLRNSGYTQVQIFDNGAEAWKWIQNKFAEKGRVEDVADIIISDVEMPQIDGFHLTKQIKEHQVLAKLPVLLYSSIVTPDNLKKGKMVGANAQVSKPELSRVVELVDELISEYQQSCRAQDLETVTKAAESIKSTEPVVPADAGSQSDEKTPYPRAAVAEEKQTSSATQEAPAPPTARKTPNNNQTPEDSVNVDTFNSQDGVTPPSGIGQSLWSTFLRELKNHAMHLNQLYNTLGTENHKEALPREVLRTLHTIKSASMVIPLDPLTRCTHLAEELIQAAGNNSELWQSEGLIEYLSWLEAITNAKTDIDSVLAASVELEALLSVHAVNS
ncbi:MAG: chemotaxis protein CheW [Pirellulales bacterium]|nr:chemotaxis protein CheW [Pirellulales bacterium]